MQEVTGSSPVSPITVNQVKRVGSIPAEADVGVAFHRSTSHLGPLGAPIDQNALVLGVLCEGLGRTAVSLAAPAALNGPASTCQRPLTVG